MLRMSSILGQGLLARKSNALCASTVGHLLHGHGPRQGGGYWKQEWVHGKTTRKKCEFVCQN